MSDPRVTTGGGRLRAPAAGVGRRRRPWLAWVLLVLLVAVPIAEVWLLVQVGQAIGGLATIAILIAEAALGGWLMRREGRKAWRALVTAFQQGRLPTGELADGALVLIGGVLLMLPGFFTDVIGVLFLLPPTRALARRLVGWVIARNGGPAVPALRPTQPNAQGGAAATVIPGEVVPEAQPASGTGTPPARADGVVISGEIEP